MKKMKVVFAILCFSFLVVNCFSQSKQIIIFPADSLNFKIYQENVRKYKLQDLTNSKDSIFLRFTFKINIDRFLVIELRYHKNCWKSRLIFIGRGEYHYFLLEYRLFNKYHLLESKKTKKILFKKQVSIDFSQFYTSYNSKIQENFIVEGNIDQRILNLSTQSEEDTAIGLIENSKVFEIELSTKYKYKFLHWNIPNNSKSYSSKIINEIYLALFENRQIMKNRNDWKNYRKNHWP